MADTAEATPVEETQAGADLEMEDAGETAAPEAVELGDIEPETPKRVTFLDYLKSPIVELVVGSGEEQTTLFAHQAMLIKSPYFADICASFTEGSSHRIDIPDTDPSTTGSVLEYLYNGEYFPKRIGGSKDSPLEEDPTVPLPDTQGLGLLKHARIYTLADRFQLPALKSLAHSKIHRTTATAKGEIAYARYVYKETSKEDTTIRKPVAAFWATRSHVLRHEAEEEFRAMCLEFPQFGFDVLSLVLDQKEKGKSAHADDGEHRHRASGPQVIPGSTRKRARVSQG
jgi:hypothetical protein